MMLLIYIEEEKKKQKRGFNLQKIGFYFEQREMRDWLTKYAKDRNVLDLFSYSGAFGVYAARGGAKSVHFVDGSQAALDLAHKNIELNYDQFPTLKSENVSSTRSMVSLFLHSPLGKDKLKRSNLVIVDPPSLAKRSCDKVSAMAMYKEINRDIINRCPKGTLLLTSSNSEYVNQDMFQNAVFQAAIEIGRHVQIVARSHQAPDSPVNLYHQEGQNPPKSLLLHIS